MTYLLGCRTEQFPESVSPVHGIGYCNNCVGIGVEEGNVLRRYVNLFFCSLFGLLRDLVCMGMQCTCTWLGIVVWYLV